MEGNSFLYGAERLALEDGTCLRLLSAWEALEAHREAEALAQGGEGAGLVRQRLPAGQGAGAGRCAGVRERGGGPGGADAPADWGAGPAVG